VTAVPLLLGAVSLVVALVSWPTRRWPVTPTGVAAPARPTAASRSGEPSDGVTVDDVADTLVLLGLALRAPVSAVAAIEATADVCPSGAGHHLRIVATALRWGIDPVEAWGYAPPAWAPAARALQLARETGAAPAAMIADAARRVRRAEARRAQERAGRAGTLLVIPLGLLLLPAFVCTAVVPVVLALGRGLLP
jgi:pilus assembly protein TadC